MTCTCQNNAAGEAVPDFTAAGFRGASAVQSQHEGVQALDMSFCVAASTEAGNQICFTVPIYGKFCITSPIPIPPNAQLKACGQTCGSFIPTGVKVTVYLNGNPIFTKVVWGVC